MNTSLLIKSTDSAGKLKQETLSYVNPNARNEDLLDLGQSFNSLVDNIYVSTTRVDKIDCDTEPSKPVPTLTVGNGSFNEGSGGGSDKPCIFFDFSYSGDGALAIGNLSSDAEIAAVIRDNKIRVYPLDGNSVSLSGTLFASETASFAAARVNFSF